MCESVSLKQTIHLKVLKISPAAGLQKAALMKNRVAESGRSCPVISCSANTCARIQNDGAGS